MDDRRIVRPEDVLGDAVNTADVGGLPVRKGTVAAFVGNAKLLESLPVDDPGRAAVVDQLRRLAPAVRAVGILDVFTPRLPEIAALFDAGSIR